MSSSIRTLTLSSRSRPLLVQPRATRPRQTPPAPTRHLRTHPPSRPRTPLHPKSTSWRTHSTPAVAAPPLSRPFSTAHPADDDDEHTHIRFSGPDTRTSDNARVPPSPSSPDTPFSQHLNNLFPPLQFPPELAIRLFTHGSHKAAYQGHNARFSFIGRRVLEAYLLLFLQSSTALQPTHDLEQITSRTLNTYLLGQHLAPQWGIHRLLRWAPPVPANLLQLGFPNRHLRHATENNTENTNPDGEATSTVWDGTSTRSVGLYKVQGEAVQAVIGGIFHQFGGFTAHRIFYTRLLPHILLPESADGLPDVFHDEALLRCERINGQDTQPPTDSRER